MEIVFALLLFQIITIAADQKSRIQNGPKQKFAFPDLTCRLEKPSFHNNAANPGRTMNCECNHDISVRFFSLTYTYFIPLSLNMDSILSADA